MDSIKKLDNQIQTRIKKKLLWFVAQNDPLYFAEPITEPTVGEYRFRIGDYRAIFDVDGDWITINLVGHRRDIYK